MAGTDGGPDRDEEPDYRFTLANERTFLSWIRTSLALLAGGVAVVQLAPRVGFAAGRYIVGELLIALSILVAATSVRRWHHVQRAMRHGGALPDTRLPLILAAGLTLVAVFGFLLVLSPRIAPMPIVHGLARQRTTLSWQRTALDFVVVGGLLLRAAEGLGDPVRLLPAGLAFGMAAFVLVLVRLAARPDRPHPGRRAVYALGGLVITLQVCAAALILPF